MKGIIGMWPTCGGDSESSPVEKPFKTPSDVKTFDGYGASASDLQCGYKDPHITEDPKYSKQNYADRWTEPKESDTDDYGSTVKDDYEFRNKDRESRGLFTRPRYPNER